jgi:hypothetical protein
MRVAIVLGLLLVGCVEQALDADLEGPRVVGSSLPRPRNVEAPTWPEITVDFSEAIDAASVRVALVAWEEVGRCEFTPRCLAEGASCERGRCMRDPLSAAMVTQLRTAPIEGAVAVDVAVAPEGPGPGGRVTVRPQRALQARARHSFLLFARDPSGAPLVDELGVATVWRRDLVTADEGSGGPEARLAVPPPDAEGVPPNLARVSTQFAAPVRIDPGATLELEAEDGSTVPLVEPEACPGWVPGLCLRWRPGAAVLADMAYRPGRGSLRDLAGRAAVRPAAPEFFVTARDADTASPSLAGATAGRRGPCVYTRLYANEPLQLRMTIGAQVDEAVVGPGPVVLGLRVAAGEAATVQLRAEDLAGNTSERELWVEPGSEVVAPALGMSEILANPRGPEPGQEFIELVDLREEGAAQVWSGLHLSDRSAAAVTGEEGDPLPEFVTRPGERVLVVAAGYDPQEGSDPAPAPGTALVRVDGSLAAGGLKNAGEPVSLYFRTGDAVVIVASYDDYLATGDAAHAGRSVVADPRSCDLPRAWRSQPLGSASPGG